MYSVLSYGQMASDGVRIDAYARAIEKAVRPGSVVVDLGAGTGIMSLLALRAGARRVHAVELDPAIWLARDVAVANGYEDRFVVHHGSSFDLELEERADVIVADLRGSSPLFGLNVAAIEDAKRRLLSPAGVLVPKRDRLFVALAETAVHRRELERGWTSFERRGFDGTAARSATLNCVYFDENDAIHSNHVVSDAKAWADVLYGEPFTRALTGSVSLAVRRAGVAHALVVWFEATLSDGVVFDNAPGSSLVYKRIVLPLLDPVPVSAGDTAHITLRTDVIGDQWAWDTEIAAGPRVRQATFLGQPANPASFLRESLAATPSKNLEGDRAARVLAMMDGNHTVGAITEDALSTAAGFSSTRRDAVSDEVKSCVRRYSR